MEPDAEWKRPQSDLFSPTRLRSSPVQYDFLGDRFIPSRSLMDLDHAHSLLTTRAEDPPSPKFNEKYRQKLEENMNLDSEGRPFRMLVFRGSPKSSRKSLRHIDEMRHSEEEALHCSNEQYRLFPKSEVCVLDAPNLMDDYYMNVMDWGKTNTLAVALGSEIYLWNAGNRKTQKLLQVDHELDHPRSVAWSEDAKTIAVGFMCSEIQLWDAEAHKLIRSFGGHEKRVGTLAWNGHILTSGSQDKSIINHDVRVRNNSISRTRTHTDEVCGLKWSMDGSKLASGGNDNLVYVWEASKISSSHFLQRLKDHQGAVKALAWCPYYSASDVLASGGGTADRCIKIWNVMTGHCINSIDTKAQVCGLEWNRHHKEILSGHGFSDGEHRNQLCLWKYPDMCKTRGVIRHSSRVLQLSQSPDGLTVASAGADETLRLWEIFGPPQNSNSRISHLDGMLSLRAFPLR